MKQNPDSNLGLDIVQFQCNNTETASDERLLPPRSRSCSMDASAASIIDEPWTL